jgi:hypothetical protein
VTVTASDVRVNWPPRRILRSRQHFALARHANCQAVEAESQYAPLEKFSGAGESQVVQHASDSGISVSVKHRFQ